MHLTKNNKILLCIILLAILIYFYYKTNNEEHMLGVDLTPNKLLFYNFLCKYFDVKDIPLEITINKQNIDLNGICIRSFNLEHYLVIKNNTIGILSINNNEPDFSFININNAHSFIFQTDGNLVAYDIYNKPVWSTNTQNKGFNKLSLNNNGQIKFSEHTMGSFKELIYNFNEIMVTDKFNLFNTTEKKEFHNQIDNIKTSIDNYNNYISNQIKKEYPKLTLYTDINIDSNNTLLDNFILISPNKQHYLIGDNGKLTIINLVVINDNIESMSRKIEIKNSDKLTLELNGDLVSYDNKNLLLWKFNVFNNRKKNTDNYLMMLENSGRIKFTDNKSYTQSYYLYELENNISSNKLLPQNENVINIKIKQIINNANNNFFKTPTFSQINKEEMDKLRELQTNNTELRKQLLNQNITLQEKEILRDKLKEEQKEENIIREKQLKQRQEQQKIAKQQKIDEKKHIDDIIREKKQKEEEEKQRQIQEKDEKNKKYKDLTDRQELNKQELYDRHKIHNQEIRELKELHSKHLKELESKDYEIKERQKIRELEMRHKMLREKELLDSEDKCDRKNKNKCHKNCGCSSCSGCSSCCNEC
jgi:hypothetical protein